MWTCPKCGSKVDETFEVCWSCGTSAEGVEDAGFVPADQADPIVMPPVVPELSPIDTASTAEIDQTLPLDLVECYQALDLMQAQFIADQLNALGIPAVADTHDLHDLLGIISQSPRVFVRSEDLLPARKWLETFDTKQVEHQHHD